MKKGIMAILMACMLLAPLANAFDTIDVYTETQADAIDFDIDFTSGGIGGAGSIGYADGYAEVWGANWNGGTLYGGVVSASGVIVDSNSFAYNGPDFVVAGGNSDMLLVVQSEAYGYTDNGIVFGDVNANGFIAQGSFGMVEGVDAYGMTGAGQMAVVDISAFDIGSEIHLGGRVDIEGYVDSYAVAYDHTNGGITQTGSYGQSVSVIDVDSYGFANDGSWMVSHGAGSVFEQETANSYGLSTATASSVNSGSLGDSLNSTIVTGGGVNATTFAGTHGVIQSASSYAHVTTNMP